MRNRSCACDVSHQTSLEQPGIRNATRTERSAYRHPGTVVGRLPAPQGLCRPTGARRQ